MCPDVVDACELLVLKYISALVGILCKLVTSGREYEQDFVLLYVLFVFMSFYVLFV